jgi:hypothetical protein
METDIVTNIPGSSTFPANNNGQSPMWKYIIIFLVLALLGFNLFTYFGQLSKLLGHILDKFLVLVQPILAYFGVGVGEVVKKTVNVTAGAVTGGIDVLEKGLKKPPGQNQNDILKRIKKEHKKQQQPFPDEAGSLTQSSKGTRKAGFCYIGEDRGFRSCISVGEGDECMSQDIYPTMDRCINPNLR